MTVTDQGCDPAEISVNAGRTAFVITNKSSTPLEWEILQGVKVIDERENIAPGFVQELKTTLDAGDYTMICGKKSGAKGKLVVKAGAAGTQASTPVDQGKLTGAIAEYKVYVQKEVDQLVTQTKSLTDAVAAGDLATAQKLYAPTRVHWERIEPIAELFSDLDKSMDSRADDFQKKEADPEFTGYHRIEKALFQDKTTDGMKPIAEKLNKDVLDLQKRIAKLTIEPKNMVGGAAELIEEVAKTKISGEEDRYSRTDLWDFSANLEGSQKIVELLEPMIQAKNPDLHKQIDQGFESISTTLKKYKTPDGFEAYEKLSESDRQSLKTLITAQAESLSKLRGTLGID
ncbi:iron uptake system protein EfeO [Pseudanabaenaceae cyanobacterium LEGE 13415]|nr:iron uptake system protein EfeO [Pseudanabaenaceae cyanobacterium LEGE 13415]